MDANIADVFAPYRLFLASRSSLPLGFVVATAVAAAVFGATPYLIPAISEELGIGLGAASLVSATQLGGFVVGSWGLPRLLSPTREVAVGSLAVVVAGNGLAATLPPWPVLLVLRAVVGTGLGLVAWLSWREALGHRSRTNQLNVSALVVAIVASPVLAWITDVGGAASTFAVLAALALVPLALPVTPSVRSGADRRRAGGPPVLAALALLAALGLFTLAGSSVFVYAAVIGTEEAGVSLLTISLAMSGNAIAGIVGAAVPRRAWMAAPLVAATGLVALAVATATHGAVLVGALVLWGFTFHVAVPAVFDLLSVRSRWPQERAGDAQAAMALGRAIGPAFGGALVATGSFATLGLGSAVLMVVSAGLVLVAFVHGPASTEGQPGDRGGRRDAAPVPSAGEHRRAVVAHRRSGR